MLVTFLLSVTKSLTQSSLGEVYFGLQFERTPSIMSGRSGGRGFILHLQSGTGGGTEWAQVQGPSTMTGILQ